MTTPMFKIITQVNKDRTEMFPYSIHLKISFFDGEFKRRIENLIETHSPVVNVIDVYIPIFSDIFKWARYKIEIVSSNSTNHHSLFNSKHLRLQEDLLTSDIDGMAFEKIKDAEIIQKLIEREMTIFLNKQQKIFMSI